MRQPAFRAVRALLALLQSGLFVRLGGEAVGEDKLLAPAHHVRIVRTVSGVSKSTYPTVQTIRGCAQRTSTLGGEGRTFRMLLTHWLALVTPHQMSMCDRVNF
jgi:hypothetical protein